MGGMPPQELTDRLILHSPGVCRRLRPPIRPLNLPAGMHIDQGDRTLETYPGPSSPDPIRRCEPRGRSFIFLSPTRSIAMEDAIERLDALIRSGARRLTGLQRRAFLAEVATVLCGGNARQAERR